MAGTGGWRPLGEPERRRPAEPVGLTLAASPTVRLARTHVAAVAGDACVTIALTDSLFFSLSPSEARGKVALSLVLTMAPFAIVAPFLGPFIDKRRGGRRRMVLASGALRAVLAMVAAELIDSVALFPIVFAMLVLAKAHGVAKSSLVRATVADESDLVRANSRLAVLAALTGLAVGIPAGIVLKLPFFGADWVLRLAAVAFGGVALLSVHLVDASGPAQQAADLAENDGVRPPSSLLAPGMFPAATAMAILRGVVGFLTFSIAFGFGRAGISTGWLGLVIAASAAGSMGGSFLAPHLRRAVKEELLMLGALLVVSSAGLAYWRVGGHVGAAGLGLAVGACASTARMAFDALVQRDNAEGNQARVFSRFEAAFQVVWVVGALIPVLASLDLPWIGFGVMVAASGGAGIYAVELWARHAQAKAPPPPPIRWPAPPPVAAEGPTTETTELPVPPTVELPQATDGPA